MRYLIAMLALIVFSGFPEGFAQKPYAIPDKSEIKIGEQVEVKLGIRINNIQKIDFPEIKDTLTAFVEVVETTAIDTIKADEFVLEQTLFITSFDSGFHAVPPFIFTMGENKYQTAPFLLTVNTVEVDTTQFIKDIKEIYKVPFSLMDYIRVYWPYGVGVLALVGIIIALIYYLKNRKNVPSPPIPEVIPVVNKLPHEIALERLELLKEKQLLQKGRTKEYYSELSDILRHYLEERFRFQALEQTTWEIIRNLQLSNEKSDVVQSLQWVLNLSDLVKFAKENPSPHESDHAFNRAREFVTSTIPIVKPEEEPTPEQA